jgi:hypothetical protein
MIYLKHQSKFHQIIDVCNVKIYKNFKLLLSSINLIENLLKRGSPTKRGFTVISNLIFLTVNSKSTSYKI